MNGTDIGAEARRQPLTEKETRKPALLVLSHVLPFPGSSGQQQRVLYTLLAARQLFHVTFATAVPAHRVDEVKSKLLAHCDDAIVLPSLYPTGGAAKIRHKALGAVYAQATGLKLSNYIIGRLDFSPARVEAILAGRSFDCALFEYWHAADSAEVLRRRGVPCVLDMHDLLWQARVRQLSERRGIPGWWKRWSLDRYRRREEDSWNRFDGVIAINREEQSYVREKVSETTRLFYTPMGIDLSRWQYSWEPSRPLRVAYYGGLGSPHNQQDALKCARDIMPAIWAKHPDAELWLVGSNPPDFLRALASERVKVTGFVEDVSAILRTMSVVICPWSGTYGFRSRLVEVMALGVPVVASPDAVFGMDMEFGKGLLPAHDDGEMIELTMQLLADEGFASEQSRLAREQVERSFGYDATYVELMRELQIWLEERKETAR